MNMVYILFACELFTSLVPVYKYVYIHENVQKSRRIDGPKFDLATSHYKQADPSNSTGTHKYDQHGCKTHISPHIHTHTSPHRPKESFLFVRNGLSNKIALSLTRKEQDTMRDSLGEGWMNGTIILNAMKLLYDPHFSRSLSPTFSLFRLSLFHR